MPIVSGNFVVSVANTVTTAYIATSDINANIYVLNPNAASGTIRLAITSANPPTAQHYMFWDFPIKASGTFVLENVPMLSGERVWISSPIGFVVRVSGVVDPNPSVSSAPIIASASTIAPTTPIAFVSGTAAIATITPPVTLGSFGNRITLIPTGAFTTTTGGNIALASTAVVNRALIMTYDATALRWYPSY